MPYTLEALASRFSLEVAGGADCVVDGVCALRPGVQGRLSYCSDRRQFPAVKASIASAVVLAEPLAGYAGGMLLAENPALAFARISALFDDAYAITPGVHASAAVAAGVHVPDSAWIGPHAVVEAGASLGERCFVGPGCVLRNDSSIGAECRLESNVYIGPRCFLGARVRVLPGAVIGGRGFGNVLGAGGWEEIPQLGAVRVGNDVEIGANTTIDRGTLDDTVIADGVRLDNLIHIAHNCTIGSGTAIAACVGIAGSTHIGERCLIGGAAVINGHLEIADGVIVLGYAMVTKSLREAGVYGSGLPVLPAPAWRRQVARVNRLARLETRLAALEKKLL